VEAEQLANVLMLSVQCIKRTNWELRGKGHKMIQHCLDRFGVDTVTRAFRPGEQRLLRGVSKEFRRDNLPEKPSKKTGEQVRIELDPRFDQEVHHLLDPGETVARPQDPEDTEAFELDERGRLKLRDPPKRKSRAVKEAADSDYDEDRGAPDEEEADVQVQEADCHPGRSREGKDPKGKGRREEATPAPVFLHTALSKGHKQAERRGNEGGVQENIQGIEMKHTLLTSPLNSATEIVATLCGCTGEYRQQDLELHGRRALKWNPSAEFVIKCCCVCPSCRMTLQWTTDVMIVKREGPLSSFDRQSALW
jgi:hypothetical protein